MATSGQITGIDAFVQIAYGGSNFNLSGDANRTTLNQSAEAPEKTTYQPTGRTRQRSGSGLKDWTFAMDGLFNDDTGRVDDVGTSVYGEQAVLTWGPTGSSAGYRKYEASGIVTTFNTESPLDGMVTLNFEMVASAGSMTKTTF